MGARVVPSPALRAAAAAHRRGDARASPRGLAAVASDMPRNSAVPVFVLGRANRCPDCHGEAFTVRRITAECAGCGLPLAIVDLRRII